MAAKVDRRIRRTRRMLSDAILTLIVERGYDAVSVQEIAERADLNRATFYLHFTNKEELLIAALEERFDELAATLDEAEHEGPLWDGHATLLTFRHVADYAPLYRVLLGERALGMIVYRILSYIARYVENKLLHSLPTSVALAFPPELVAHQMAGGLYALVSWWVINDMPHSPEYMARVAYALSLRGLAAALPEELLTHSIPTDS
jgi:AcrR family transcriptional regulator